jgi:hypothetical protein
MKHKFLLIGFALLMTALPLAAQTKNGGSKAEGKAVASTTGNESYATATFERLKKLDGKWIGRSTKGWQEEITFKTIAQGSVVHESSFDAHPNETMATMYYLDGNRLLLTHYCVSKTQPRLLATGFEDNGRKITFTFVDATNLASRDKGHMDKVVFNFIDEDHFTSQWTWYQAGKEQWLEEIRYERAK